jgi:hypothetical protein
MPPPSASLIAFAPGFALRIATSVSAIVANLSRGEGNRKVSRNPLILAIIGEINLSKAPKKAPKGAGWGRIRANYPPPASQP